MTDEELYGTIAPTPRNPYVGAVADAAGGMFVHHKGSHVVEIKLVARVCH